MNEDTIMAITSLVGCVELLYEIAESQEESIDAIADGQEMWGIGNKEKLDQALEWLKAAKGTITRVQEES